MIILKVTEKQGFTLSLGDTFLEKLIGVIGVILRFCGFETFRGYKILRK